MTWEQTTMNPRRAYYDGRKAGQAEVAIILQNLIDDIVGQDGEGHEITMGDNDECLICKAVDRAERRLREMQNE